MHVNERGHTEQDPRNVLASPGIVPELPELLLRLMLALCSVT